MSLNKGNTLILLFAIFPILTIVASFSVYKLPLVQPAILVLLGYFSVTKNCSVSDLREIKSANLFLVGWLLILFFSLLIHFDTPRIALLENLLYGILFMRLKRLYAIQVFRKFVWLLAVILAISSIEFLIIQIFGKSIILDRVERLTTLQATYFDHYLFNIVKANRVMPRFQSLADEPGRLGTLCGLLLFPVWRMKDIRKPFYVLTISGLLSFSLAFYVLFTIFLLQNSIKRPKTLLLFAIIVGAFYYTQKENFDQYIVQRLEDPEETDNRTSEYFQKKFEEAISNGQIVLGLGKKQVQKIRDNSGEANSGGKVWISEYGLINFFILFAIYIYVYKKRCCHKMEFHDYVFIMAFCLSFYQRQSVDTSFTILPFFIMPLLFEKLNETSKSQPVYGGKSRDDHDTTIDYSHE